MNPELQKELAAWLTQMRGVLQQGGSFALTQAPLVVQERIAYGRASETAFLFIGFLVLWSAYWCGRRASRWDSAADNPLGYIWAALGGLAGVIVTLIQMDAVMKVWFAPRIYVIEWLSSLVK